MLQLLTQLESILNQEPGTTDFAAMDSLLTALKPQLSKEENSLLFGYHSTLPFQRLVVDALKAGRRFDTGNDWFEIDSHGSYRDGIAIVPTTPEDKDVFLRFINGPNDEIFRILIL